MSALLNAQAALGACATRFRAYTDTDVDFPRPTGSTTFRGPATRRMSDDDEATLAGIAGDAPLPGEVGHADRDGATVMPGDGDRDDVVRAARERGVAAVRGRV